MDVSSHKDSAREFCCAGSIYSMKLLGFMSKAIKLLLTELVDGSVKEYIALSLFRIDLPSVGQYGKGRGQYIPALTSHSVNKSIRSNDVKMPRMNQTSCTLSLPVHTFQVPSHAPVEMIMYTCGGCIVYDQNF